MRKFDFKDITLVPETLSSISSRNEIDIKNSNNKLPIIVSPMDTVIDYSNYSVFSDMKMEVCLPRNERLIPNEYDGFISISLTEFESMVRIHKHFEVEPIETKILVDIANGHMTKLQPMKSLLNWGLIMSELVLVEDLVVLHQQIPEYITQWLP